MSESATQYAERLLASKVLPDGRTAADLANFLVTHYKDHGFVIDVDESRSLLGNDIVKERSKEYEFANDVFRKLDLLSLMLNYYQKKRFQYIGSVESGAQISDHPKNPFTGLGGVLESGFTLAPIP